MNKKLLCLIAGVVAVIVAIVLIVTLGGADRSEADVIVHGIETTQASADAQLQEHPTLVLLERKEDNDLVELVTSYATLSFPYAFSDLVCEELVDNGSRIAIDFYAVLNGSRYPVYTISFTGEGDIPLGTVSVDDVTFEMSAKFYDAAPELEGDNLISFHAAQETFNDVWLSLEANENFTSAQ